MSVTPKRWSSIPQAPRISRWMPSSCRPLASAKSWCDSRSASRRLPTSPTIWQLRCAARKRFDTMDVSINGKTAFAATGGREFDPARPPVVLIHGAGFDHSAWALHSRYFAHHGHSVLAPDLPGHGRSAGPPLRSIAEMADWIAALLDTTRAAKAQLIGHSMGSLIALETSARHPAKVSALIMIGTAAAMSVGPELLKA